MSIAVKKYNLTFSLLYLALLVIFILMAEGELVPVGLMLVFANMIGLPGLFSYFVKEELSDEEIRLLTKYYGKWTAIVTLLIFLLSANQLKVYVSDAQLLVFILVILIFIPLFGYISRFMFYLYIVKFKDYRSINKK